MSALGHRSAGQYLNEMSLHPALLYHEEALMCRASNEYVIIIGLIYDSTAFIICYDKFASHAIAHFACHHFMACVPCRSNARQ